MAKSTLNFSGILDEVDLWEEYVSVLTEREGAGSGDYQPEEIVAEAVRLTKQALNKLSSKSTREAIE